MSLRMVKRVVVGIISLAVICGIVYWFFFTDPNLFVMDFMSSQGFHPDPESKDFTVVDGMFRLALNIGILGMFGGIILVSGTFLFMAIVDVTLSEQIKKKSVVENSTEAPR